MSVGALELGYRRSVLAPHQVVVSAELGLAAGDRVAAEAEISEIVRWRREHQPGGANAGSVFTNPPGDSAGRLLDAAGAKGLPPRQRRGVHQARQLHPGRRGRLGRRRRRPDGRAVGPSWPSHAGVDLHAETHLLGFDPARAAAAGAHLLTGLEGLPGNPRSVVEG